MSLGAPSSAPEAEPQWLALAEEALIFSDRLVADKYDDLDVSSLEDEYNRSRVGSSSVSKTSKPSEAQEVTDNIADKYVGIVHVDSEDYYRRALREFTRELSDLTATPSDSQSSFESVVKKRLVVQKFLHAVHLSEKMRKKKQKKRSTKDDSDDKDVPIVVRLGVLSLFPLIESLSGIKDANYQRLCTKTLDIVIKVLNSVPALSLSDEPADVLDAFRDFIFGLVKSNNYIVDSPERAQALVALVGLAVSRGQARHLLHVIDVLFNIYKSATKTHPLPIASYVKQIAEFRKESDAPLLTTKNDEPFFIEQQSHSSALVDAASSGSQGGSPSARAGLASDGSFLYVHTPRSGLCKVGTGLNGTIKGFVYVSKPEVFADDCVSLARIGGELYALPSKKPSASAQQAGRVVVQFDPQTLVEIRQITLTDSAIAVDGSVLVTDGALAYLIGRCTDSSAASAVANSGNVAAVAASVQAAPAPVPARANEDQMEVDEQQSDDDDMSGSGSDSSDDDDDDQDQDDDDQDDEAQPDYNEQPLESAEFTLEAPSGLPSSSYDDLSQLMASLGPLSARVNELLPPGARIRLRPSDLLARVAGSDSTASFGRSAAVAEVSSSAQAPQQQSSSSDKFIVEVYQVGKEWQLLRKVDLALTATAPKQSSSSSSSMSADEALLQQIQGRELAQASKDSASVATLFNRMTFYTNGVHLVALVPTNAAAAAALSSVRKSNAGAQNAFNLVRSRVYSLSDGKIFSETALTKPEVSGLGACIDATHNIIWTCAPTGNRRISSWLNMGLSPQHQRKSQPADSDQMDVDDPRSVAASLFSGEAILAMPELAGVVAAMQSSGKGKDKGASSLQPLDSVLILLTHMDRIARQHPIHSKTAVVDESCTSAKAAGSTQPFCVDPDRTVLHSLYGILQHALDCLSTGSQQNTFVYIILATLRLLKVNLHELISSHKKIGKYLLKDEADKKVVVALREMLLNFVVNTSALPFPPAAVELIQQTAASALLVGFVAFYPQPSQQAQFVLERLQHPEQQFLLDYSLEQLAGWYRVSDILGMDHDDGEAVSGSAPAAAAPNTVNRFATQLVQSLISFSLQQTQRQISNLSQLSTQELERTAASTVTLPASVRLLLSLQRDIVAPSFGKPFVAEYTNILLTACAKFIEFVNSHVAAAPDHLGAVDALLQRSLLRVVLPSLSVALCRRNHTTDLQLVDSATPAIMSLVSNLDALCRIIPACQPSDSAYLRRVAGKREKKIIVETKHPYPFGKLQQKETVTVVGADQLVLRFDARSRTVMNSSDALQLFLSDSLDAPVMNGPDATYFSGTNFPKHPIVIPGNTVTFFFTQGRIDPSTPASARWGFRCSIAPVSKTGEPVQPESSITISSWLLDLANNWTLVSGRFLSTLIEGEPTTEKEKENTVWLASPLFSGGVEPAGAQSTADSWLEAFVDSKEPQFDVFFNWMKSLSKNPRPMIRKTALDALERAMRFIIAVLIKHTGIIDQVQTAFKAKLENAQVPQAIEATLARVVESVAPVTSMLNRRGDVEKDWQIGVEDKSTDFSFFTAFQSNPDRLMELCEMHGVEFDIVDTNETVKRLFAKLQEEAAQLHKMQKETPAYTLPNPYELICAPVVDRCRFLLKLSSSAKSTPTSSVWDVNEVMMTIPAIVADGVKTGGSFLGVDSPSSSHPLSKSATHPPSASATEREKRRDEDRKVNEEFDRRVGELRRWLGAYSDWKNWQESAVLAKHSSKSALHSDSSSPHKTPVDAILSFVSTSLSVRDFEKHVRSHVNRAASREKGLRLLNTLLSTLTSGDTRFGSLLHQLLGASRKPLRDGGHYLDSIQSCGESLRARVSEAFRSLFSTIVQLAGSSKLDPTSRLLAIRFFTMSFAEQDVQLLKPPSSPSVFELLQRILLEPAPKQAVDTDSAEPADADSIDIEDDGSEDAKRARENAKKQREKKRLIAQKEAQAVQTRYLNLRDAAWTAFRLLATQCIGWSISDSSPLPKPRSSATADAQEHVYRLMNVELKRLSVNLKNQMNATPDTFRDGEQCYQLLSLMYLLGSPKPLAQFENVENLLSILSSPATAPRAQRLILRLFRRILPTLLESSSAGAVLSADQLTLHFLDQIAAWVFKGKFNSGDARSKQTQSAAASTENKKEKQKESENVSPSKPEAHSVLLHSWAAGGKRLTEVLSATLGAEFTSAAGGAPVGSRPYQNALDAKSQLILNEMASNSAGAVVKQSGTLDQCTRLAQALASAGATVTVAAVAKESEAVSGASQVPGAPARANSAAPATSIRSSSSAAAAGSSASWESQMQRDADPVFWINGHVSDALASEYIALVRFLLKTSPAMATSIQQSLVKFASLVPEFASALVNGNEDTPLTWSQIESRSLPRCLSALCVLSGFKESVHVGGKVNVKPTSSTASIIAALGSDDDHSDRIGATVVNFDSTLSTKVEVIFDSDLDSKQVTKLDLKDARAVSEIPVDPAALANVTMQLLPALFQIINVNNEPANRQNRWLLSELRCRALEAANNLLQESKVAQHLISNNLADTVIPSLIKMSQSCDPAAHTLQLERTFSAAAQRLWDIQTSPEPAKSSGAKPMVGILPFYPHSDKVDLLPTAFEKGKQTGLIFWGSDLRSIENTGIVAAPARGARSVFQSGGGLSASRQSKNTEILLLANAVIPTGGSVPDYYYEVTIESSDSSPLISVGFAPEGASAWIQGSYHFQANRQKSFYSGGNRRNEAYGAFMRAKDVIGCGWNSQDKTIFFTRNGEDLGVAFTGVFTGGSSDRIVPAVGLGKGVRLRINFGQEPFKFSVEANSTLDDATRETRRKEAEERRKKEIEEEEARRKKEKEVEDARKRAATEPLTSMGYTMKQALKALEMTGWSGAENAVLWILEHGESYNFDDEPEPEAEAAAPAEEKKPEPAAAEAEKPTQAQESSSSDAMEVDTAPAEDAYDTKISANFLLGDAYTYDVEAKADASGKDDQDSSEWEQRFLPEIKNFMEKDGFTKLEVNDFLQQIRNELSQGHESEARAIVSQIMGDAMHTLRLPNSSSGARQAPAVTGLKVNQLSIGMLVSLIKPAQSVSQKSSISSSSFGRASLNQSTAGGNANGVITTTLPEASQPVESLSASRRLPVPGAVGVVKAVQPQKQLALVEFYSSELAVMENWWIPVQALQKPTKADSQKSLAKISSAEQLQQMLAQTSSKLANIYARRILITLVKNKAPLIISQGSAQQAGIQVSDALNLAASEFLSATKVIVSSHSLLADQGPPKGMDVIRGRLFEIASKESEAKRNELTQNLVDEATSSLNKAARLAMKHSLTVNSLNSPAQASGAFMIEIPNARAIVVQFERAGTYLHAGTRVTFYWDEDCMDPIKTFPDKSPFLPLAVPASKFYARIEGKKDREKSKVKFVAVPVSTDASLARWLIEHLLDTTELHADWAQKLFDSLVDFLYRNATPSAFKQSLIHLLARMLHRLRRRGANDVLAQLPLKRLHKLKQEMISLHDYEKRRADKPFSSYLQSLVELGIAVRLHELELKSEKENQVTVKADDAMFVAIALAKTLQAEKEALAAKAPASQSSSSAAPVAPSTPPPFSPQKGTESAQSFMGLDDSHSEEGSDGDEGDEGDMSMDNFGEEFGEDDEDEMLKLALQESMRLQQEQDQQEQQEQQEKSAEPQGAPQQQDEVSSSAAAASSEESSKQPEATGQEMDVDMDDALRNAIAMSLAEPTASAESVPKESSSEEPDSEANDESDADSGAGGGEGDDGNVLRNIFENAFAEGGVSIPAPPAVSDGPPLMGPPAPPAPEDPAWFSQLVQVAQALECICFRDDTNRSQNKVLAELARKAWTETKKDSIKERLVILEDVPVVPADNRRELLSLIEEAIDECAQVTEGSVFVPVDHASKTTKKFAVIELQSADKIKSLIERLGKDIKLRVPRSVLHTGSGLNQSSDNLTEMKVFALRGCLFTETEAKLPKKSESSTDAAASQAQHDIITDFLRSKLFDEETRTLTTASREALTEVFVRFSTDHTVDGVLAREQLDALQMASVGEALSEDNYKYIVDTYETKQVAYSSEGWAPKYRVLHFSPIAVPAQQGSAHPSPHPDTSLTSPRTGSMSDMESDDDAMDVDGFGSMSRNQSSSSLALSSSGALKETIGVTLKGFLDLYTLQAHDEPVETWQELTRLGYDLHLHLTSFSEVKDAVRAIVHDRRLGQLSMDEELVRYAEQLYGECELTSPIQLTPSHISPINPESHVAQLYPRWARIPLPTMRLRFEILRQFNSRVQQILPLVDLSGTGLMQQLLSRSRGILFHAVKMHFFYDILDKTSLQDSQPTVQIDRLRLASRKEGADPAQLYGTEEALLSNTAFGIVFNQLRQTDPAQFRQKKPPGTAPHFSLKVDFKGEHVEGEGGPYRQFFTDVSKELTKVLPLLVPCPNAQAKVGRNRDKFIVAPSCNSRTHLRMYRFLGQLMGMAIRTGVMLTVDLPSFFWKPLVEQPLTLTDLRDIDHAFYGSLKYIRLCERKDLEDQSASIFQKFVVPLSDKTMMPLKPHGDKIDLSYANRDEYLRLAEAARLNEASLQMQAIRRGLAEIVPSSLLNLCSWQDLEWRVCGRPQIDVKLLKRHTTYSSVSPSAPHIKYFWQVLKSFSQTDRRAFVRFAWAQERLPGDDQEFERTQTRMLIKPFTGTSHPDSTFPKADTCFFNLMLPEYSSPDVLRERLLFAIHTDADSMDADERNQEPEPELRGLPRDFMFR